MSGGTSQINVAQDRARIAAEQNVRGDAAQVVAAVRELMAELDRAPSSIGPVERAELQELGDATLEEAARPTPRKSLLTMFHDKFLAVGAMVEASDHVADLVHAVTASLHHLLT